MRKAVLFGVALMASIWPAKASEDPCAPPPSAPRVSLFVSVGDLDELWPQTILRFARPAARHYGFDLQVLNIRHEREEGLTRLWAHLEKHDPRYAILSVDRLYTAEIMKRLNERGIDIILLNTSLNPASYAEIGDPGETLPHYVAKILPDDEQAGHDLAVQLAEAVRARTGEPLVRMVGIEGKKGNPVSKIRVAGLRRAAREDSALELLQVTSAHWQPETAAYKIAAMEQRYGRIDAVWVANDQMAMSVLSETGPERGTLVGAIDGTWEGRQAILAGRLAASMAGHAADVVYALATFAAIEQGHDPFAGETARSFMTRFGAVTRENAPLWTALSEGLGECSVDFTALLGPAFAPGAQELRTLELLGLAGKGAPE